MAEMESDNGEDKKYVRDHSSELNIESIISAPLVAASKANVVMVTGQTRFLLDYCFNKIVNKALDANGATIEKIRYEPVLIEMLMTRSNLVPASGSLEDDNYVAEHLEQIDLTFTIPLLCIIPINSLVIDKVTVDFDLDITSTTSYSGSGVIDKQAQLNGRISKQSRSSKDNNDSQYKSQTTSLLKVNINAGPLPLPIGVLTILDLYVKAISPTPVNKKAVVISK